MLSQGRIWKTSGIGKANDMRKIEDFSNDREVDTKGCRYSVVQYVVLKVCIIPLMARWLSWLERRPVTAEVDGSIPFRVV